VGGKAEELQILEHPAAGGLRIVDDDGAHLIEQQLPRHAAEIRERRLERLDHRRHGLARIELEPEQARVAEDDEEDVASPPREAKGREVHLGLMARRRLEPHNWIDRRSGTDLTHEELQLRDAAGIASRADFVEQPHGAELRIGVEPRGDDRLVGVELRRDRPPRAGGA